MTRISIRWLLLGVAAASLLLPLLALLLLRTIDPYLVQQTERELGAEGALVAEMYRALFADSAGVDVGDPRPPARRKDSFVSFEAGLRDLDELEAPMPDELPRRAAVPSRSLDGSRLSRILRSAQIFTLSGVRVLDETGCVVASSREQLDRCFTPLPEVASALDGRARTVLRPRSSDEPAPPFGGVRRRGDIRVFVALPVFRDGQVIGAIWLSRTAESGLEFLFKERRGIFYGALLVMGAILLVTTIFARLIVRPLVVMERAVTAPGAPGTTALRDISAPREIHALGAAFDRVSARLEARARYVSEFAENVSHELKTPLTSIRGAIELLRDAESTMDATQRERFLSNIDAAARRTDRLVARLLFLARIENQEGRDATDTVTLDEFVTERREDHGDEVVLRLDDDVRTARLPHLELAALVGNLVDNARRARKHAPVRVSFVRDDDSIRLTVEDDGAGISPENRARLFERFFTTERDRGGTGLGLAIVKAIAEARDGRVEVTSDTTGTRVDVWFRPVGTSPPS